MCLQVRGRVETVWSSDGLRKDNLTGHLLNDCFRRWWGDLYHSWHSKCMWGREGKQPLIIWKQKHKRTTGLTQGKHSHWAVKLAFHPTMFISKMTAIVIHQTAFSRGNKPRCKNRKYVSSWKEGWLRSSGTSCTQERHEARRTASSWQGPRLWAWVDK